MTAWITLQYKNTLHGSSLDFPLTFTLFINIVLHLEHLAEWGWFANSVCLHFKDSAMLPQWIMHSQVCTR